MSSEECFAFLGQLVVRGFWDPHPLNLRCHVLHGLADLNERCCVRVVFGVHGVSSLRQIQLNEDACAVLRSKFSSALYELCCLCQPQAFQEFSFD